MAVASLAPLVKSKIKVRAAVKGLSVAEIEKLISNLTDVLKSEKKKETSKAEAVKNAKIAKIKALMEESGLKPSDIQSATVGRRGRGKAKAKAKRKAAPKYRLVVDGQEHLWSGRGRPPKVFKAYMDSGKSKESCAIK
jgi:DNA-binding protein H-NS